MCVKYKEVFTSFNLINFSLPLCPCSSHNFFFAAFLLFALFSFDFPHARNTNTVFKRRINIRCSLQKRFALFIYWCSLRLGGGGCGGDGKAGAGAGEFA